VQIMTHKDFSPLSLWNTTRKSLESRVQDICQSSLSDCVLIDNPEAFKKKYKQTLEQEQNDFEHVPQDLMEWGEYNVEESTAPKVDGNCITFYVKDQHQIPLKVTVDPFNQIECGPLPLLN